MAPETLEALKGSCVVIPCTFHYGTCSGKSTPEKAMWSKDNGLNVFDQDLSKIDSVFTKRTELLGDVRNRNCSLKISNVKEDDSGLYTFRVEGSPDKCDYSYSKYPVKLTVDTIGELIVNYLVNFSISWCINQKTFFC